MTTARPNQKVQINGRRGTVVELPKMVCVNGRWTKMVRVWMTSGPEKGQAKSFALAVVRPV